MISPAAVGCKPLDRVAANGEYHLSTDLPADSRPPDPDRNMTNEIRTTRCAERRAQRASEEKLPPSLQRTQPDPRAHTDEARNPPVAAGPLRLERSSTSVEPTRR